MSSISVTSKVLTYVEKHLDNALTLGKIAEELNYSKFYIARVFKEDTGLTLYQYIRSRRLNESARKLIETEQSILEIAFCAGYNSQQAFTQAFHQEYECTPQEYRRTGVFIPRQDEMKIREKGQDSLCITRWTGEEMAA